MIRRPAFALVLACVFSASAAAQEGSELVRSTIRVRVVSRTRGAVFLDKGRSAGLVPGIRVRLFVPSGPPLDLEVRSSTSQNARVDLQESIPLPPIGTQGEAEVRVPASAPGGERDVAHPPWTAPLPETSPEVPLLAPVRRLGPADRPLRWRGRAYVFGQRSFDRSGSRDSTYDFGRLGVAAEVENPFGHGGRALGDFVLDFRGEEILETTELEDARGRLDRLSYAIGFDEHAAWRGEIGRFLSREVPELGLVDGAEGALRLLPDLYAGAGGGAAPEPLPSRSSEDNTNLYGFLVYSPSSRFAPRLRFAYQQTWFRGAPDRSLFLLGSDIYSEDGWSLRATAKVDHYTSSDTVKGEGFELTEFWASGDVRLGDVDLRCNVSRFRWAELLREEYAGIPAELLRDGRSDRAELAARWRVTSTWRLEPRVRLWQDQDDSGFGAELSTDFDRVAETPTWIGFRIGYDEGVSTEGYSIGLRFVRELDPVRATLSYRFDSYEYSNLATGGEASTRHDYSLSLESALSTHVFGSLEFGATRGDESEDYRIGFYLQYRL